MNASLEHNGQRIAAGNATPFLLLRLKTSSRVSRSRWWFLESNGALDTQERILNAYSLAGEQFPMRQHRTITAGGCVWRQTFVKEPLTP
jgi:hypothetical protein